jgi:hypothetical protein
MATTNDAGEMKLRHKLAFALLVSIGVTLLSGKVRGPEPDNYAGQGVEWLQDGAFKLLSEHCCRPAMAAALVSLASFTAFSLAVLAAGDLSRRLPCLSEFIVHCDLSHRRGSKLAGAGVALGYSVPFSLGLALVAKSSLSIYATLSFSLTYAVILLSTDRKASKVTLTFFARLRNALPRGSKRDFGAADADELEGDV